MGGRRRTVSAFEGKQSEYGDCRESKGGGDGYCDEEARWHHLPFYPALVTTGNPRDRRANKLVYIHTG
jgi:hypothetical protein